MKTKLNFFLVLAITLAITSFFAACSTIETAEPSNISNEKETLVSDRFCGGPINCQCTGIPTQQEICNFGGHTEQMATPRCNERAEYQKSLKFGGGTGNTNNHYIAYFDEKAICQPQKQTQTGEMICEKTCYNDDLWIDAFINGFGKVHISSIHPFQENSFVLLGVAPNTYTVTYENEPGLSTIILDLSPGDDPNFPQTFPANYLDEMMIFNFEYSTNSPLEKNLNPPSNTILIQGIYDYEDGLTISTINGTQHSYGIESLGAVFHVTDANSSIITFRSTKYTLSNQVKIYDNHCAKAIQGTQYSDEHSTYLRINSEDIFNCIWPQQEEFNFSFKLAGTPLQ